MESTNIMPIYSVRSFTPQSVDTLQFTSAGTLITTLTIASAVSIGSNILDVQNGSMTMSQALLNGVAKGTAATLILNVTSKKTSVQVALTVGLLAGAGYLIDSAMQKNKQERSLVVATPAK